MKNITLLVLLVTTLFSCKKSKEEQLIFDYEAASLKKAINVDINDTDFKINKVEKVGDIKSMDSIKYFKDELATLWFGEDVKQIEKDTITFGFAINEFKKIISSYEELITTNRILGKEYSNYKYKNKLKTYKKYKYKVLNWSIKNDKYSKNKDSILAYKYKANTTITSPLLKVKQTFDKVYYTDASGTKIAGIIEE